MSNSEELSVCALFRVTISKPAFNSEYALISEMHLTMSEYVCLPVLYLKTGGGVGNPGTTYIG